MERMEILDLEKRCYRELSGGQQQRVLLARALLAAHEILMLDEPVTGLDPSASAELYDALTELNKKHGLTIIMISHDIARTIVAGEFRDGDTLRVDAAKGAFSFAREAKKA